MFSVSSTASIRTAKTGYIILSICFSLMGIYLWIVPDVQTNFLFHMTGILFVAFGIIKIIGYLSRDLYRLAFQYDLAFGILLITLGLIVCLHPRRSASLFFAVVGTVILADGLFRIQLAIDAKRFGITTWWLILLIAIATGTTGTLLLIFLWQPVRRMIVMFGVAFIAEGLLNLCTALSSVRVAAAIRESGY